MSSDDNLTEVEPSESTESIRGTDVPREESSAFLALEKAYRAVLAELEENEGLSNYSTEFTRLFEALYESHNNEEKLKGECEEVQTQLAEHASKIALAMRLQQADQETIDQLKTEVESLWKTVDSAHARERIALETIENLRGQIGRLNSEIELKARQGSDHGGDSEFGTASKNKDVLARERERLIQEITSIKEKMQVQTVAQDQLERKYSAADLKLNELGQELETKALEALKSVKSKERLEQDLQDARGEVELKQREAEMINNTVVTLNKKINKLETAVKDAKYANERLVRDNEGLKSKVDKWGLDYEAQARVLERALVESADKDKEILRKEEEAMRQHKALQLLQKKHDGLERKLGRAIDQKADTEKERDQLKEAVVGVERDLEATRKEVENVKRLVEGLTREREMLQKHIGKQDALSREHAKMIKIGDQVKKKLETQLAEQHSETYRQRKVISHLEKDRDRYIGEAKELTQQVEDTVEEVKLKQQAIYEQKKKLAEGDTKYRMQQNLFEQVRADRNTFSKNLLESQDQITELKHKLKVMTHQIEQLKEDVTTKEQILIKSEFALQKLDKEKEGLRYEVQKVMVELKEKKADFNELQTQANQLQQLIKIADDDKERQKKDMDMIMNERDILGTQLVRRNDELSLLYEKIRILQHTLHKGESQYDQRLEDIRLLKLEIKRLRQEKAMLAKNITNMADLRQELLHLERDFTRESLKCRALEEELQNPLNVHRWRKLEGSDPAAYELILKIQLLQKRLICQSGEALAREQQLQETEQLYKNLRQLLVRQPGPDAAVQLQETKHELRDRGYKMRSMMSELNMYEAQVAENKLDLERVKEELLDVKKKYFALKRRDQLSRMKETKAIVPSISPSNDSRPRFTGGGFSLSPGAQSVASNKV